MNNYTTIEQSKKLLEFGLNPNMADMYYEEVYLDKKGDKVFLTPPHVRKTNYSKYDLPCWSIGALIKVLPSFIKHDGNEYAISIFPDGLGGWCVDYSTFETEESLIDYIDKSLVDALFYMCCWLLENNFYK